MKKLKGILLSFLLVVMTAEGLSQQPDLKLLVAIDGFAPALKVGLKKDLSDRFSIQGSAGCFIMGPIPLSWNVFGSYRITNPDKPLGINLNFGLLDNYIVPSVWRRSRSLLHISQQLHPVISPGSNSRSLNRPGRVQNPDPP